MTDPTNLLFDFLFGALPTKIQLAVLGVAAILIAAVLILVLLT